MFGWFKRDNTKRNSRTIPDETDEWSDIKPSSNLKQVSPGPIMEVPEPPPSPPYTYRIPIPPPYPPIEYEIPILIPAEGYGSPKVNFKVDNITSEIIDSPTPEVIDWDKVFHGIENISFDKQFDFTGISAYDQGGYTGEQIDDNEYTGEQIDDNEYTGEYIDDNETFREEYDPEYYGDVNWDDQDWRDLELGYTFYDNAKWEDQDWQGLEVVGWDEPDSNPIIMDRPNKRTKCDDTDEPDTDETQESDDIGSEETESIEISDNESSSDEYIIIDNIYKESINNKITTQDMENISQALAWSREITEEDSDDTSNQEGEKYNEGSLEIIIGNMYSGKSTALLLKSARMADIGLKVLYINHSDDVRSTEAQDAVFSTHSSQFKTMSDKIDCIKVSELNGVDVHQYDFIGIDESQFFDDLYDTVVKWVVEYGKNVIVASLDGDSSRRKFGQVLDLIPHADKVEKMCAICDTCRERENIIKPAPFTARMVNVGGAKLVGGRDLYKAMCRKCHDKHLSN